MRLFTESNIRHPVERVYRTYRDDLPKLADYLPDIEKIMVEASEDTDTGVKLHNVWFSDREIPSYARKFISPEVLRWDDYADWRDDERLCHWEIKLRVFRDSVTCSGKTVFAETGETTKVTLEGDFQLDLKQIPGVPKFLAGGLKPRVEKFIVSLVRPNLERVNTSLQSYLDEHAD